MIARLGHRLVFPDPTTADKSGIVAFGGDLSPSRVMLAYREGIFPWYCEGDPILWWSPDPRLVLRLDDFKLRRSLKKRLKIFEVTYDRSFDEVVYSCAKIARDEQDGSWILPQIEEAYSTLHTLGYAHSVETWQDGELVGGLYGVCVGGVFCGESMFSHVSDASKVAFVALVSHLKERGFKIIDCQIPTQHLKSLGAVEVSRESFLEDLFRYRDLDVGFR